jgi:AcrR family transcriptional regulator
MEAPFTPVTRRDRERSARRRAMLDAALAVFAEKGFAAATMEEIAERAEFGKGTLYNYFADKHALLLAAFDEVYDGLVALATDYFASEDDVAAAGRRRPARAVFHDFIARLIRYFQERRAFFIVLVKEGQRLALASDAEHVAYFAQQRDRVIGAIERPLAAAMARGELRPLPPRPVAHLLMGNVQGYLMFAACAPPSDADAAPLAPAEAADFIATVLFDGLLAAPA